MTNTILLATHNRHKLNEFQTILAPLEVQIIGAEEARLHDVDESGQTFIENALLKARAAFRQTRIPALADDSGLCITALNGEPGIHSARFAKENGGFPAVFEEVFRRLEKAEDRSATFMCCLAFVTDLSPTGEQIFTGCMNGRIDTRATGENKFGYDPIFIPDGYTDSCGVLPPEVKNKISHRAKALTQFTDFLRQNPDFRG